MSAALLIALPLLAAFLLPIASRVHRHAGTLLAQAALASNLLILWRLWQTIAAEGPRAWAMGGFPAPLGITLYADATALLFAAAVSAFAILLWAWREPATPRESTLMMVLVAGGCGLALSGDLFNLFVFYEIVSVASFGLVAARGTGPALAASLRYLILSAMASALGLLGIGLVYALTGTLNLAHLAELGPELLTSPLGVTAFALMLLGFGVKAELFPVNTWVPEVYATAGSRISALLAGVTSKLALLVVLRLVTLIYAETAAMVLLLIVGLMGVILGELAAYRARDLRRVLAYSSIAQLGLAALAFSVPGPAGVVAGLALAGHHMLVKPALYLLCERWGGSLDSLTGAARVSPLGAALFVLLALSLIGIPPLPGFWAKYLTLTALFGTAEPLALLAAAVVLVMTVVEAAYLIAIARRLYEGSPVLDEPPPLRALLPASALGATVVAVTLLVAPVGRGLDAMARQAADPALYSGVVQPLMVPGDRP